MSRDAQFEEVRMSQTLRPKSSGSGEGADGDAAGADRGLATHGRNNVIYPSQGHAGMQVVATVR